MTFSTFLLLLMISTPPNGARVQLGNQQADYLIKLPGAGSLPGYANNGYRQRVKSSGGDARIRVNVKNVQLASKMPARHVKPLPEPLAELERRLNQEADGLLADQLMILFTWLRAEVDYSWNGDGNQELAHVMASGQANCVGLANLALFVLKEMDVEARYVTGIAWRPEHKTRVRLEGDVLHRWIEIHYDDVGWVFCDPAGKVNFVEATYVVLGVENLHPLSQLLEQIAGGEVELLRFQNGMRTIARFPGGDRRLRVRPNRLFTQ